MADTIISDGKGNYMISKGGQWVPYNGPLGPQRGTTGSSGRLSAQDQKFLNDLSTQAQTANETARIYDRAEQDVKRLGTGPYRGQFLGMATPEDNGGILDKIGAVLIGGPARITGAIRGKDTDAFQRLRGLQSQQVLQGQLAQKGPQTESDAARLMLTEISPSKTVPTNLDIIQQGRAKAQRAQAKAQFYNEWAQKFGGVRGLNPKGTNVDAAWSKYGDQFTQQMFRKSQPNSSATVKVISRQKVR